MLKSNEFLLLNQITKSQQEGITKIQFGLDQVVYTENISCNVCTTKHTIRNYAKHFHKVLDTFRKCTAQMTFPVSKYLKLRNTPH